MSYDFSRLDCDLIIKKHLEVCCDSYCTSHDFVSTSLCRTRSGQDWPVNCAQNVHPNPFAYQSILWNKISVTHRLFNKYIKYDSDAFCCSNPCVTSRTETHFSFFFARICCSYLLLTLIGFTKRNIRTCWAVEQVLYTLTDHSARVLLKF